METVANLQANHENIPETVEPTLNALVPLLRKNQSVIYEIPKQTFKYGPTDRHQLDIYYPIKGPPSGTKTTPILVWCYGGGFSSGERTMPPPFDIGYACVGAYFARRGFLTVIPDYRLVPNVTFPGPAEDIRDALVWVVNNPNNLVVPGSSVPDLNRIFMMGHSAGGTHIATMILLPEILASTDLSSRIVGVIMVSAAFTLDNIRSHPEHILFEAIVKYMGEGEESRSKDPIRLLERASESTLKNLPQIMMVEGQREPKWLVAAGDEFLKALSTRTKLQVPRIVPSGHNHVSLNWALGTGEGEEWAEQVIKWMVTIV